MRRCFGNLAGDLRHKSAVMDILISIFISTAILCVDVDSFVFFSILILRVLIKSEFHFWLTPPLPLEECMLTFKTGMQALIRGLILQNHACSIHPSFIIWPCAILSAKFINYQEVGVHKLGNFMIQFEYVRETSLRSLQIIILAFCGWNRASQLTKTEEMTESLLLFLKDSYKI